MATRYNSFIRRRWGKHQSSVGLFLLFAVTIGQLAFVRGASYENDAGPKNVYGKPLQSCSSSGMALTGFTRNGHCVDQLDDVGSHHICIDLSSTTGGNFCTVTGQPNWCSSNMPCHDNDGQDCPIQQWCVCQWAFAKYIQKAGGCDHIQKIECDAVNMEALTAYRKAAKSGKQYMDALKCIESKCGLSEE